MVAVPSPKVSPPAVAGLPPVAAFVASPNPNPEGAAVLAGAKSPALAVVAGAPNNPDAVVAGVPKESVGTADVVCAPKRLGVVAAGAVAPKDKPIFVVDVLVAPFANNRLVSKGHK